MNIIQPDTYCWDPRYMEQPYSLAVERHGLLCISGLTAEVYDIHRDSYIVDSTSLVKQTKVIFEKMEAILSSAGYTFQDVVYTVDYAVEAAMPEYRASGDVRRQAFGNSMPASTGVLVDGIPDSAGLIMINAVAMQGGRDKRVVFPEGTPTWERYRDKTYWPGFFVGDDWFWLSGATGRVYNPDTKKEQYPYGITAQAEAIWNNTLGQVMKDALIKSSRSVRICNYVHPAGVADYPETHTLSREFVGNNAIATTSFAVHRLLHRDALLEIDATCYLGKDREVIDIPEWNIADSRLTSAVGVRCGKYLFCSAQGPVDHETGNIVGLGDLRKQAIQTYKNILKVLEAAGGSARDVVRTIEFTNPQNAHQWHILDQTRRDIIGRKLPAVTRITTNQLLQPKTAFGMEIWAILE